MINSYFLTGRNNAFDWAMYAPCGNIYQIWLYNLGWIIGICGYPFNRRRKWRKKLCH